MQIYDLAFVKPFSFAIQELIAGIGRLINPSEEPTDWIDYNRGVNKKEKPRGCRENEAPEK